MNMVLEVKDVSKTYKVRQRSKKKETKAVRGVSFDLPEGERLGIIGASGCGKSTLLKLVLQSLKPDGGAIRRNGRVGFVSQDPYSSLCKRLSVENCIGEPLLFTGLAKNMEQCKTAVWQVMKDVHLDYETYAKRHPHQLSGGERQRVCIARALILQPDVLILDEPTSMLDYQVKASLGETIYSVSAERKMAILLVTHDIEFARNLCDRILVMKSGEIIESGNTEAIWKNPGNAYTKKLFFAATDLESYWQLKDRMPSLTLDESL